MPDLDLVSLFWFICCPVSKLTQSGKFLSYCFAVEGHFFGGGRDNVLYTYALQCLR